MFFERLLEDAENGLTITARELPACLPMPLWGAGRAPAGNAIPPCVGQSRGSRPLLGKRGEEAKLLPQEPTLRDPTLLYHLAVSQAKDGNFFDLEALPRG